MFGCVGSDPDLTEDLVEMEHAFARLNRLSSIQWARMNVFKPAEYNTVGVATRSGLLRNERMPAQIVCSGGLATRMLF